MNFEMLGYLGGGLITVSLLPQVIKSWKTKSTKDISILYTLILLGGLVLYAVYARINRIMPLAISASIEFFLAASLIVLKIKYR